MNPTDLINPANRTNPEKTDSEKIDIEKLSNLARLALSEEEKSTIGQDIQNILGFVNQITSVSLNVLAEDSLKKSSTSANDEAKDESNDEANDKANGESNDERIKRISRINMLREDVAVSVSDDDRQKLLNSMPKREGDYLKVKKIISYGD